MFPLSRTFLGLALGSALLLKVYAIRDEFVFLTLFSILLSALLTYFLPIRSIGFAGIGGLSLVYLLLGDSSPAAKTLITIMIGLVSVAVLCAIFEDLWTSKQGEKNEV